MVRDINNAYLNSLQGVFPAYRKGQLGDSPKVNCATCHQGIYKPLYGVSMLKTFPELAKPYVQEAKTEAPVQSVAPVPGVAASPTETPMAPTAYDADSAAAPIRRLTPPQTALSQRV